MSGTYSRQQNGYHRIQNEAVVSHKKLCQNYPPHNGYQRLLGNLHLLNLGHEIVGCLYPEDGASGQVEGVQMETVALALQVNMEEVCDVAALDHTKVKPYEGAQGEHKVLIEIPVEYIAYHRAIYQRHDKPRAGGRTRQEHFWHEP